MKVLITGVEYDKKGMIGTALRKYLEGWGVTVLPFNGDIRHQENWDFYDNLQVDMVIHLAAKAGVRQSIEEPDYYWDVNVNGTAKALAFAERHNIRILYASSSNAWEWWVNPYAASKKACEALGIASKARAIGMRFHTVWPGRDDMLFKMIQNNQVDYINVHHTRDWIHIDDMCEAIWTLMQNFDDVADTKSIVDIGNGKEYNVAEVFEEYSGGKKVKLNYDNPVHERVHTKADNQWLLDLGWKPTKEIL